MEFLPETDEGRLTIGLETRVESPAARTADKVREVERIVRDELGVDLVSLSTVVGRSGSLRLGSTGSHLAYVSVVLSPKDERRRDIWTITSVLSHRINAEVRDVKARLSIEGIASLVNVVSGDANPVVVEIEGEDLAGSLALAGSVAGVVTRIAGTRDVDVSYRTGKPELQLKVKHEEAAGLGISPLAVAATVRTAYKGVVVSRFRQGDDTWDVHVRLRDEDRRSLGSVDSLFLLNPAGTRVPLENLVDREEDSGPVSVERSNKTRLVKVTAALTGERSLDRVVADVQRGIQAFGPVPAGMKVAVTGTRSQMEDTFRQLAIAMLLGMGLVYVVMASQFESLLHPFIVMFSIPFAAIGLVAALLVTNTPFSMVAFIGAILLVGYVVNNAILLIDYFNVLRRSGLPLEKAIIIGGRTRLKPILMSTVTTILGLLPMALGIGTGSELRARNGPGRLRGARLLHPHHPGAHTRPLPSRGIPAEGEDPMRNALVAVVLLLVPSFALPAGPGALSLAEALRLADETSEAVRIRALQAGTRDAVLAEARSRRYPRLVLEASASYLANPPEGITVHRGDLAAVPIVIPDSDLVFVKDAEPTYYKLGATLTQPLYTSGKIEAGIRFAELDRAAAGTELDRQRREIRRDVARAYHGAVLAGRSLPLLEAMHAACADIVADRHSSFTEGTVTRQAVLDAEASLASFEARIVAAREARSSALEALAVLTGLAASDIDPVDGFRDTCPRIDEDGLRALAAADAPDVASARTRFEQAGVKRSLERAGAAFRPELALSVAGSVSGQRTPFVGSDWTDSWDWSVVVSVGASAAAFDSGASRARISAASSDIEAAAAALSQAEKLVRLSVRKAVEAARNTGAALAERRARLALAGEAAKNARVSWENDVASRAQARLAEIARLAAALDLEAAGAALEDAIGEIEYLTGVPIGAP